MMQDKCKTREQGKQDKYRARENKIMRPDKVYHLILGKDLGQEIL
jgi:hypothetical protein